MRKIIASPFFTGVLLALSFPTYPYIHLEVLAWVAFVLLLYRLKETEKLWPFLKVVYLTMLTWIVLSVWWVSTSTIFHGLSSAFTGLLMYVAQSFFSTMPFLAFFVVKKYHSFKWAVRLLPFFWVAWEWFYMGLEISFPWLTLGNSQSNFIWLIQYADLVGVYGVSCWIMCFNVLAFEFTTVSLSVRKKIMAIAVSMIAIPLIYAGVIYIGLKKDEKPQIKAAIIQPNINPYQKWQAGSEELWKSYSQLIDSAYVAQPFDIAVLPETALPYYLFSPQELTTIQNIKSLATAKHIAVLFGFVDIKYYVKNDLSMDDNARKKGYDFFNSSALVPSDTLPIQVYHKVQLVPFAERVPYMDIIPLFSKLTVDIAGISSWGKGKEKTLFSFRTENNEEAKLPGVICYESIYPEFIAEFVQQGATALAVITNDGWFLKTYGPYQHAAFSRLRAIENRRSLIRCANTGISFFVDEFGSVYGERPWWKKEYSVEPVTLNQEMTLFTLYPNAFPLLCLAISIVGVGGTILLQIIRKK